MRFEFATSARIVAGPGTAAEMPSLIDGLGQRALLVIGRGVQARGGPAAELARALAARGWIEATWAVGREPDIPTVEGGAQLAIDAGCDLVIGLGGGSVIDTAKAIAGLATNPGGALEYMEVVGAGRPLSVVPLPVVAVPTTAGTGSEVTRNAVITSSHHCVKASIRHPALLPRLAVVDSILTHDMPPAVTASSGLDALTQLMEPFVSRRAQPLTDGLCREGLARVGRALRRAYHHGEDTAAREEMSVASLMSGLALANAGLGAIHGIAAPLGGRWQIAHGAACASLMAAVTEVNIRALERREPDNPALDRYVQVAALLMGHAWPTRAAALEALILHLRDLAGELHIPRLSDLGLTATDIPDLAQQASKASSTRGNPLELEPAELEDAIAAAT